MTPLESGQRPISAEPTAAISEFAFRAPQMPPPVPRMPPVQYPNVPPCFDRKAVITIQGGGVFGFSLLGQLQGLLNKGIEPFALAGTSAGAIVATLFWAGLPPEQIRDHFVKLAGSPTGLSDLVGPFDSTYQPFDYNRFRRTVDRYRKYMGFLRRELDSNSGGIANLPRRALNWVLGIPEMLRVARDVLFPFRKLAGLRGIFSGDTFEAEIDKLLRLSPLVQKIQKEDPMFPQPESSGGRALTFGDFHRWLYEKREFFGPLFLTATNLVTRELELIEFPNEKYFGMSVARAVRASGGFPFFFRPVNDTHDDTRFASYVDGGLICNFPAFVFAETFRESLVARPNRADYQAFAARTWVHIGLRLGSSKHEQNAKKMSDPEEFAKAIFGLAAGGARSELEQRLAGVVSRSLAVEQPPERIGGPPNVLDIHELTPQVVKVMFSMGREEAERIIGAQCFDLPDARPVRAILKDLVKRAEAVLRVRSHKTLKLRSNVFVPHGERLFLRYSFNMDDPGVNPDYQMNFGSGHGLTGFCFLRRAPMLCNLNQLNAAFDGDHDPAQLFGLTPPVQDLVRVDRTWLLSVPIFDPYSLLARRTERTPTGQPDGPYYTTLPTSLDGAVFGVLNLDANLVYGAAPAYDSNPANLVDDPRICTVRDIMLRAAHTLGGIFSAAYPGRK